MHFIYIFRFLQWNFLTVFQRRFMLRESIFTIQIGKNTDKISVANSFSNRP